MAADREVYVYSGEGHGNFFFFQPLQMDVACHVGAEKATHAEQAMH